jgi:hypothetical protein
MAPFLQHTTTFAATGLAACPCHSHLPQGNGTLSWHEAATHERGKLKAKRNLNALQWPHPSVLVFTPHFLNESHWYTILKEVKAAVRP